MAGATNQFSLVLEYLKANPRGEEADIVLLSCFGAGMEPGEEKQRVVKHKKDGECALRRSGLQYAIVRPAVLSEEPSGGKALVFDQGERLTQTISCADVADVCVKSLHDSEARNRTFDVAYDKGSEGDYELKSMRCVKELGQLLDARVTATRKKHVIKITTNKKKNMRREQEKKKKKKNRERIEKEEF